MEIIEYIIHINKICTSIVLWSKPRYEAVMDQKNKLGGGVKCECVVANSTHIHTYSLIVELCSLKYIKKTSLKSGVMGNFKNSKKKQLVLFCLCFILNYSFLKIYKEDLVGK